MAKERVFSKFLNKLQLTNNDH